MTPGSTTAAETDARDRQLVFHLIIHTHWDREWYLPRAGFLPRLVTATGELLDLLERDADARFVLDGQTVIVEDVLAVRPDWRDRIAAALAQRRLEVGPWYILADELIPSGESLIRNLLHGARDCAALGGRMNVLYSPDAFGHPAILPSLANEFGMSAGVIWRGLGRPTGRDQDLYRWRGPDGSIMTLYHLPAQGYEIGAELASRDDDLASRWRAIRKVLLDRTVSNHVAVFVGADHHAPPAGVSRIRDRIQAVESGQIVRISTLGEYFDAVASVGDAGEPVTGELRWSYGHAWTLQGVHSTRARLKRQHGAVELYLQRQVEPLAALAEWAGNNQRALLRSAWRTLLQCQFHDTLCGCASDAVAAEQRTRLMSVAAMGHELARSALHAVADHDPDAARIAPDRARPTLVLWNPVARARHGIAIAETTIFRNDVPVGPPSGRRRASGPGFRPFALMTATGSSIPVQVLAVTPATERIDAARHYPDQDDVDRVLVAFDAPAMGGLGMATFRPAPAAEMPGPTGVIASASRIANRFVEVHVGGAGQIDVVDRRTGERYAAVLGLVDERDEGDAYTPSITPDAATGRSLTAVRRAVLAPGPLVAATELRFQMRSAGRGDMRGRMVLIVHADSPVVRVRLELDNRAGDHRLRLRVPVGAGDAAVAGAAFGFEPRNSVDVNPNAYPAEHPVRTAPAHRYVAARHAERGLALLCPGFFEYEWTAAQELIFTVLRSVGELSRASLPGRPGHAAWPMPTPDAQEPGTHIVELALVPLAQSGSNGVQSLEALWEDAFLPSQATFIRDFVGTDAFLSRIGIELEGHGLVFSSLKPAESQDGWVLRCYNTDFVPVSGRWRFRSALTRAMLMRADETLLGCLELSDRTTIEFTAPARGIVTILVQPELA